MSPAKAKLSARSKASVAPPATDTEPREPPCPTWSVPADTVVPPVRVFAPVSTRVPAPLLARARVPATPSARTPAKACVPEATPTVRVAAVAAAPLTTVGVPTVAWVVRPARVTLLPDSSRRPVAPEPKATALPEPRAPELPSVSTPAPLRATLPERVLAAPSTRAPPLTVRPPWMDWAEARVSVPALTVTPPVKALPRLLNVAAPAPFLTRLVAPVMPKPPLNA